MLKYMSWTVYRHITPNGKSYIGITSKKLEYRWNNGRGYLTNTIFGRAIKKYGWNNIQHNIVSSELTETEAKWLENYLICYYRTFVGFSDCNGYNCTLGGDGVCGLKPMKGKHHTDETKRKIGESHKGIPRDEETKRKISEAHKGKTGIKPMKGKHHTDETKRKISEAHKGKTAWNKGIPRDEETKRKISEAHKGIPRDEETKRKISEAHKGKTAWNKGIPRDEETKHKMSESRKGMHRVYHEDGTFHMER